MPWSVLISTIWKKVVQKHSCQNHRLKKVPSWKLSAYSITVRQASNGWYSSAQCFNSTSDKTPVAIHFSLITQPLLICRHFTLQSVYCFLFITACSLMHYLLTSYSSCHGICLCFMLCSSSGSKWSFSRCFYSKQWFPCSNLVLRDLPYSRAQWWW